MRFILKVCLFCLVVALLWDVFGSLMIVGGILALAVIYGKANS